MVKINAVDIGSACAKAGVAAGDFLVSVNEREISDILDYRFYITEKELTVSLLRNEVPYRIKIRKKQYDDIGLEFDSYLMDEKKSCCNKCVFCFIDQNPKGMRESIYFKDDDARLSFFFGNYITLTNLKEQDVQRIIEMHISPINISVHTTNPELRVKMMHNKNAGESLSLLSRFYDGQILMNAQIVLCRGLNDGEELKKTLDDLSKLHPYIGSIAVVPSGLSAHREGLSPLEPYDAQTSAEVIEIIHRKALENLSKFGLRLIYPSDEWFIKANIPIPEEEYYEDYPQIENGVGMISSMKGEIERESLCLQQEETRIDENRIVSVVTGEAAYAFICESVDRIKENWNKFHCNVYLAKNLFFGGNVTVTGLLTGSDLYAALQDKNLGDELFFSSSMLRHEGDLFLDNMSIVELETKLNIKMTPVSNDGAEFVEKLLGIQM